jgi:uncharacterized protein YbjT (DUF2867 family)
MENKTILITGASGNIGYETIRGMYSLQTRQQIIAGDYQPEAAKIVLQVFPSLQFRKLDFADPSTFDAALEGVDIVFLLRPPQLADIQRYFSPFVQAMKRNNVTKVVFLSVQGVEDQPLIPHHKLEKLIEKEQLDYVFLRPGYFMQNLTTTLLPEIKSRNTLFIPSGKLKFNWVDARDIGMVGAHVLSDFDYFRMKALEITGSEFTGFDYVVRLMSEISGKSLRYESPNLVKFFLHKRKLGMAPAMIFVMIMLHFLPRFGDNKQRLTTTVKDITGKNPGTLRDFIEREKDKF